MVLHLLNLEFFVVIIIKVEIYTYNLSQYFLNKRKNKCVHISMNPHQIRSTLNKSYNI